MPEGSRSAPAPDATEGGRATLIRFQLHARRQKPDEEDGDDGQPDFALLPLLEGFDASVKQPHADDIPVTDTDGGQLGMRIKVIDHPGIPGTF